MTSLFTNQLLLEFIHILKSFYHLLIGLVLYTHLVIDASRYARVGLTYSQGYFF